MKKNRYQYLDLLKVIAITFVCMYHFRHGPQDLQGVAGMLRKYVYSILSTCVPLFFAVNGALLLNSGSFCARKHFKKLLVLLLQYFVWHGITAVVLGIAAGVDFTAMSFSQLINVFLFLGTPEGVDLNHFWFVPTLCGIYLLYPFLKILFEQEQQNQNAKMVLIGLGIAVYFLRFFIHDFSVFRNIFPVLMYLDLEPFLLFDPFGVRVGTMLLYFLIGGFLHGYQQKTRKIPALISILMVLAGLLISYRMVIVKGWMGESHFDIVFGGYGTTGTLLCTVGLFLLASGMEEKLPETGIFRLIVQKISSNTMTIYYSHWILGSVVLPMLPIGYGWFWNLLKTVLFVACGTLLGEGMKKIPVLKYLAH